MTIFTCMENCYCPHRKTKRCQSKPLRFRGTLLHTSGYRREIRNLSKSFVISQVSYETLSGFAAERVSYQTPQRQCRQKKVSYETVFFSDLIYKRNQCVPNRNSSHYNRFYLYLYIIQFAILLQYSITALAYIILHARPFLGAADSRKSVP
jgi:hypothetical protein